MGEGGGSVGVGLCVMRCDLQIVIKWLRIETWLVVTVHPVVKGHSKTTLVIISCFLLYRLDGLMLVYVQAETQFSTMLL